MKWFGTPRTHRKSIVRKKESYQKNSLKNFALISELLKSKI